MTETQSAAALPDPDPRPSHDDIPSAPPPWPPGAGRSALARFFGVLVRSQTWLNLVYLALAFPLGLFYFVFLVVGLSVGLSLVIVWVGIFVLGITAACWWAFAAFERYLADTLLHTRLAPAPQPWRSAQGTWPRIKAHFSAGATWKDLAFLFVKFPLGLLSFTVVVSLGAAALAFLGAPFYYRYAESTGAHGAVHHGIYFGVWTVDRLWEALLLVPIGILLTILVFHAFNGLAAMWRGVARGLLVRDDGSRPVATAAEAPRGPAAPPPAPAQPSAAGPGGPWPQYSPYPPQAARPPQQGQQPPAQTTAPWPPPQYGWPPYYPTAYGQQAPPYPQQGMPWPPWPALFGPSQPRPDQPGGPPRTPATDLPATGEETTTQQPEEPPQPPTAPQPPAEPQPPAAPEPPAEPQPPAAPEAPADASPESLKLPPEEDRP
jgi:hypothetical protein